MTSLPAMPGEAAHLRQRAESLHAATHALADQLTAVRKRLAALEAGEKLAAAGRPPRMPVEFRSQFGEDLAIWNLLGRPLDGFFIEIGAFDGYSLSVTYALEAMGWTGLLIEGIPERAALCAARRPASRVVNAAVSKRGSTGTATFHVADDAWGGMLSYFETGAENRAKLQKGNLSTRAVTVPLVCMDDLLKDHPGEVDAASIDVEGGEVDLLDGFDLDRFRPKILVIEDNPAPDGRRVEDYLRSRPYVCVGTVAVNQVFVRRDLTEVLARARDL